MKWTEEKLKEYGIEVKVVSEATWSPRISIVINNKSVYLALTREFIQDVKAQTWGSEKYLDDMIDDEIEKHPEYKRQIRKKKLEKLNEIQERR